MYRRKLKTDFKNPPPDEETESGEFPETFNELDTNLNRFPRASKNNVPVPAPPAISLDTNRLDTMLSYMQMFAQTTNAIFLQKDIMENNSTTFRAMTELLNLDSLKPEDLNSESDMKTMIAAFKDLPNKVASEKEVEDAEKTFQVLLEMKEELKNVKQYDKWEPKEALKADLTDIEDHGFEIPVLANLKNAFTNININIDNILGYNPTSIDDRPSYFRIIETRCQEITSLAPETLGNIGEPVKFKSGYTAEDYISNLQPLFNLVHSLEEKKPGLSMPTDLLTNSAAAIASFSITVPPFLPILSALHSTFKNTTAIGGGRELLRTFGLPRGLTDLRIVDSLEKSYGKDKWLAKVSKVSKIAKGLKPLHVFVEKVEEVFKQLNSQRPVSMDQVYDYIQKFGASQIDPKAITDGASKCIDDEVLNDATALPDLSTLQSGLTSTETVLGDLKTVLNTVAEFVKSDVVTELLTGLKDIAGRASGALTQTVEDLKAYNLTEVREVFADFNKITWLPSDSCPIYSEMVPVVKIGEDTIPWTKTSNTFNFLKCIGDWKMFNRTGGITVCMKPFLLSPAVNLTVAEDYCESIGYKITGLATVIEAQWVIAQILKLVPNLAPEWEGFWIDGYRNCPPPLPAGCSNFSYSDGYTVTGDISSKTTLSYNDWTKEYYENCLQVTRTAAGYLANDVDCDRSDKQFGVVCGYQLIK